MREILRSFVLTILCLSATNALFAQNCTINAGVTTSVCPNDKFMLSGSSSGRIAIQPVWSQVGGPAVTIKTPNSLTSDVSGYAPGMTYKFRLSAKCEDGSFIYDEVTYNTYPATIANAGPDISVCAPGSVLHANAGGAGETGTWSIIGDPRGVSFNMANSNNPNLAITADPEKSGNVTLRWTLTSTNSCRSSDDIVITVPGGVSPVDAGADQVLTNCYTTTQSATMSATYGGNGTSGQQGTWSVLSGPTVPKFSDIHDNKATVTNLQAGTYKLRWTVQGPCANGVDDVLLEVPVGTQSVSVAKDAGVTYCDGRTSTIITGLSPAYAGETFAWTRVSGTGDIISPNSPTTEIKNLTGVKSVFRYTISNPNTGCNTAADFTVNYTAPPTITAASPLIAPCDATMVTVNYSYTGGDKTQWALISAPAGVTPTDFADAGQPLILPQYTIPGTYLVRLKRTTNNGLGGCQDQYADVYVQLSQSPTAANAGTRQVLACNVTSTNLAGNLPAIGNGSWSQVSGPGIATIADVKNPTTFISQLLNGTYIFRWIITGGTGCPNQQADVQVVVSDKTPTAAAAGPDVTICNSSPYKLQGNLPKLNETGVWTVTPATGVTFSDVNDPAATVNGLAANTAYTFTWTISNSCGTGAASVHITTSNTAGPQQADAGPDKCLPSGTSSFSLAGNAPASGETGKWSIVGSNTLTFADNTKNNTGVSNAPDGNYLLEWSLSKNGCPQTRDTVLYTISAGATAAAAGSSQSLCGATTLNLQGNQPAVGIGTWTQQQGPGGITISNPASNTTAVNNLSSGRYIFRWTISNGACAANFAEVTYNISAPPTPANAGKKQVICGATSAILDANTITSGIGTWSVVNGPSNPTFANPSDPKTTISKLQTGDYTLRWTANSGPDCPVSTDDVIISVRENAKVQTTTQQLCNATAAVVSGNEGSMGTWTQTSGNPGPVITPNSGNAAVITNMTPGNTYQFNYTIGAIDGCASTSAQTTIITSALPSAANAGEDQAFCLVAPATVINTTLNATPATNGTGTWTVDTKPAEATNLKIVNPASPTTAIQNLVPGIYVFNWTVSNGYCTSNSDIMRIVVSADPSAAQPGADQNNACTDNILLNAVTPVSGIGTWSIENAPAGSTAIIEGINAPATKVLNAIVGTYTFRWTVANGVCASKTALVNVTISSTPPNPAVANIGDIVKGEQCITTGPGQDITLAANMPQGDETGAWTITHADNSPVTLSFDPANPHTTVSNVPAGSYLFRWTITNGSCSSHSDLPINVYAQPTLSVAGAAQNLCLYTPITLGANVPATGTGKWTVISNPAGVTPAISDVNNPATDITGLAKGNYVFRWTISNGACPPSISDAQVTVDDCGIKVVKTATQPVQNADGSYDMTFTFTLTNPGNNVKINNIMLTDNIKTSLPAGATFTVTNHTLTNIGTYNSSFNGNTDINLLQANTASLKAGDTATISITVNVKFF
ncbi:hypothetical protein [Chitinophaga sp. Cy-1792]|uniref:hypothetical protein n=1 Tax=Chitinophaga sp. Cy-1792 TaxID=2608339 RepID=UPI00141FFA6F|nr:hypothetical protein [Chitinophaga sp. Cy-1792]NIG56426.1 hypothetical protein [Chitinophaga sp. Cy-1792]